MPLPCCQLWPQHYNIGLYRIPTIQINLKTTVNNSHSPIIFVFTQFSFPYYSHRSYNPRLLPCYQLSRKCWRRTDNYKQKTPLIHSRHSCTCLYWISIWKMFLKVLRYDWQLQTKKTLCHSRPRFRCLTKWITIRGWKGCRKCLL